MSLFVMASLISVQDWEELLVRKLPLAARECAATVWRGRRLWQGSRGDKFKWFQEVKIRAGTVKNHPFLEDPPVTFHFLLF